MTELTPYVINLMKQMIECGALSLRDIEKGEKPFVYSSGNRGPGYVMVKGLVSQRILLSNLTWCLAAEVLKVFPEVEYVAGNATGGMIPGWLMAEHLSSQAKRDVPYFYVRGSRKLGGHGETLTGNTVNKKFFTRGRNGLVVEELVNFAVTTTNSALEQRDAGYDVRHAATILNYDHQENRKLLEQVGVQLTHLFTLAQFLEVAESQLEKRLVDDYREFLRDPKQWQLDRGYNLPMEPLEIP